MGTCRSAPHGGDEPAGRHGARAPRDGRASLAFSVQRISRSDIAARWQPAQEGHFSCAMWRAAAPILAQGDGSWASAPAESCAAMLCRLRPYWGRISRSASKRASKQPALPARSTIFAGGEGDASSWAASAQPVRLKSIWALDPANARRADPERGRRGTAGRGECAASISPFDRRDQWRQLVTISLRPARPNSYSRLPHLSKAGRAHRALGFIKFEAGRIPFQAAIAGNPSSPCSRLSTISSY